MMHKKLQKAGLFLLSLIIGSVGITLPASAVQSPGSCNSNRLNLSISRDKLTVKQGDILTYTVTISNLDDGSNLACDIDTATVTVTLPALDGTPTGQVVTLTTTGNYPAGTPISIAGTVPYTVNVNANVTDATAEASVSGVLHDAPTDHAAQISKTIGTTIVRDVIVTPPSSNSTLPGMPNTATSL